VNEPERLQAVIFDLDGVLVSTSRLHAQAWGEMAGRHGGQPPADLEEQNSGALSVAPGQTIESSLAPAPPCQG
jgi:beta-phosphoglucomutase-like phosphatase (HAD superfamily)